MTRARSDKAAGRRVHENPTTVRLTPATRKRLRIACIEDEMTVEQLVTHLLDARDRARARIVRANPSRPGYQPQREAAL